MRPVPITTPQTRRRRRLNIAVAIVLGTAMSAITGASAGVVVSAVTSGTQQSEPAKEISGA